MGIKMIELILPWAPSVNSYYLKTKTHVRISPKGQNFRDDVAEALAQQAPGVFLPQDQKLFVEITLHVPDKRKRDLDNYLKSLFDALTKAGLWDDDSQIDQLHVYRGAFVDKGMIRMVISDAGPVLPVGVRLPS